jgi:transposase
MIQITPQMRILLAVEPVDFRRGIDGLAALCRQALGSDPQTGALFVFRSRRGHAIKCLTYDGQGYWCCQNMHDSHCAVIEDRKAPLPVSSLARPRVGDFRGCRR